MKTMSICATGLLFLASTAARAQYDSPPAQTSVGIGGKKLAIKYCAPSVHGRDIFSRTGVISHDGTYPVWRAGANDATAFHTDADLMIGNLAVPKGDYTIFVLISDPNHWKLIINKQTGQWGLTYNQGMDLGRVDMNMSKPPSKIETYKMTLSQTGPKAAQLQLEWDNTIASVPITVK